MIASTLVMSIMFQQTIKGFEQDIVNVNLDNSYLHWVNTFPAISICFSKGLNCLKFYQIYSSL